MNVVLWILQGLLALVFLGSGLTKLSRPKDTLRDKMPFVDDHPDSTVKGIGAVEVLGALGLILPAATGIAVILTPLAAAGLVIVMIGAVAVHLKRGEQAQLAPPIVLGLLALVVAVLRFGPNAF
ncbi:MAG: DoxX family protein [Streptosporangiaceae bacterium]